MTDECPNAVYVQSPYTYFNYACKIAHNPLRWKCGCCSAGNIEARPNTGDKCAVCKASVSLVVDDSLIKGYCHVVEAMRSHLTVDG